MANNWARDRATMFYLSFGLCSLAVVAFGFGWTYAVPMVRRTFIAPWFVHLHGISAFAWVAAFIGQAALARGGRTAIHRGLGQIVWPLAPVIWASGIATATWATERDIAEIGSAASSALAGTVTGLSLYLLLVLAAMVARKRPDWHKRLVMLATIQLLWPAFFRLRHWFPAVPDPEVWFALVLAYLPILIAAVRDRMRYGTVHPVWLFVAPALIAEQIAEVIWFDHGVQRAFGQWLYTMLV